MPCTIRLLPIPKPSARFHDFDEYERLVEAAKATDARAYLIVLLGGEAGLRCGEMMALQWSDVDLGKRQLCVQRSAWKGHVTTTKGGRLALRAVTTALGGGTPRHRHCGPRCCASTTVRRSRSGRCRGWCCRAARRAKVRQRRRTRPPTHVLFAPLDEGRTYAGDSRTGRPPGSRDDSAVHAFESRCGRKRDSTARRGNQRGTAFGHLG